MLMISELLIGQKFRLKTQINYDGNQNSIIQVALETFYFKIKGVCKNFYVYNNVQKALLGLESPPASSHAYCTA